MLLSNGTPTDDDNYIFKAASVTFVAVKSPQTVILYVPIYNVTVPVAKAILEDIFENYVVHDVILLPVPGIVVDIN